MKLKLEINCTNDAFVPPNGDLYAETAHLLFEVAEKVDAGRDHGTIVDGNGNTVGSFRFTDEE